MCIYIYVYVCVFVNEIFFYFHMPARKPHASTCYFLHNGNRFLLGGCFDMFFCFLILFLISGSQLLCFSLLLCISAFSCWPASLGFSAFLRFPAFVFLLLCFSLLFFCLSFCKLTLRSIIQYTNPRPI